MAIPVFVSWYFVSPVKHWQRIYYSVTVQYTGSAVHVSLFAISWQDRRETNSFYWAFSQCEWKSKLITLQFLLRITKVKKTHLKSIDVELDFATCSLGDV